LSIDRADSRGPEVPSQTVDTREPQASARDSCRKQGSVDSINWSPSGSRFRASRRQTRPSEGLAARMSVFAGDDASPQTPGTSRSSDVKSQVALGWEFDGSEPQQLQQPQPHRQRPISAQEFAEARIPLTMHRSDFPPMFTLPKSRVEACGRTSHYDFFAKHLPSESPALRREMQKRAEGARRGVCGQEPVARSSTKISSSWSPESSEVDTQSQGCSVSSPERTPAMTGPRVSRRSDLS